MYRSYIKGPVDFKGTQSQKLRECSLKELPLSLRLAVGELRPERKLTGRLESASFSCAADRAFF
jgi:hypothetical protein